jgi:hypothetical protein
MFDVVKELPVQLTRFTLYGAVSRETTVGRVLPDPYIVATAPYPETPARQSLTNCFTGNNLQ